MAQHNELGKKGEEMALHYLTKKGFKLIAKNYRFKHQEVDLILEKDLLLVAVEVKTRQSTYLSDPHLMVSRAKQRAIIRVINAFIVEHQIEAEIRFDIVAIVINKSGVNIRHIPDAFYPLL